MMTSKERFIDIFSLQLNVFSFSFRRSDDEKKKDDDDDDDNDNDDGIAYNFFRKIVWF